MALIRDAVVDRSMPYLGFCLGHQLLVEALGGQVGASAEPEVGIMPVDICDTGPDFDLLQDLPQRFDCLQWHAAEVLNVPVGADVLAKSKACAVQVMAVGPRAISTQFHPEIKEQTVVVWMQDDGNRKALETVLGPGADIALARDVAQKIEHFNTMAWRLYQNWRRAALGETSTTN